VPNLPKVFLLITDAGGGHRASANSLKAACEARKLPLEIRVVNVYREIWQDAEPLGRATGIYGEDIYNFTLKHSLLALAPSLRNMARWAAHRPNPLAWRDGLAFLEKERPALCISLMPFVNDTLAQLCAHANVPFALTMTDLVDIRPYMWYTPQACRDAAWVTAPCAQAAEQARESGASRVLDCGLLLHPKYYAPAFRALDQKTARKKLGLETNRTTILLSMGGFGGSAIEDLVEGLEHQGAGFQIVAACGRNEALLKKLQARPRGRHRLIPLGFTQDLHLYLKAADLMAGKPGPASLFEAVAAGTPMVLDAASTMPQEAPNANLAQSKGWALSIRSRRDLPKAVSKLAQDPQTLAMMAAAEQAYPFRDTPDLLANAVMDSLQRPQPLIANPFETNAEMGQQN